MQNQYKDMNTIGKITYSFGTDKMYDHVISKSRYIQKALEHNFRKLFSLNHRGYMKKIGCLVPGADTNIENRLFCLTMSRQSIIDCP